jgi:hypothetical protein
MMQGKPLHTAAVHTQPTPPHVLYQGAVLARTPRYPTKVKILERVLTRLGMPVQRILPAPLKMSGGDFIPANADLCFIGVWTGLSWRAMPGLPRACLVVTTRHRVYGAGRAGDGRGGCPPAPCIGELRHQAGRGGAGHL